jgi:hypothetical protein
MLTTTAMSMDRFLIRILDLDNGDRVRIAFRKILPGGTTIEIRKKTEQREDAGAFDCVIEQSSPVKKIGDKEVALFTTTKDRRSERETFAIVL